MKKKFVLTLALVLMVAATLVAAPIEMTGAVKAGYTLSFNPNGVAALDTTELDLDGLSVSGDFWKVSIGGGPLSFDSDSANEANLSIYLDKALAEQGVDMGDVTVTLSIGNMGGVKPSDVYSDANDAVAELEMLGVYSSKVTVGYTDMVTVEFAADPTNTADKPIMLGAKFAPVDGVKAAVGYTNYAIVTKNAAGVVTSTSAGLTGSAVVDVAALADLDFGLSASLIDVYFFEDSVSTDPVNRLYAEVKASIEDITVWAEYQNVAKKNNMIANVSYAGIENVGLSAKLTLNDLSDIKTIIGAGATYAMGGVTYALDAEYAVATEVFTLKPSVKVTF